MVEHGDPLTGYVDPFSYDENGDFAKLMRVAMGKPVEGIPMRICDGVAVSLDGCVSCKLDGCDKRAVIK